MGIRIEMKKFFEKFACPTMLEESLQAVGMTAPDREKEGGGRLRLPVFKRSDGFHEAVENSPGGSKATLAEQVCSGVERSPEDDGRLMRDMRKQVGLNETSDLHEID